MKKIASFKSLKTGDARSGSISQRYGSADSDPQQHVTDPQQCSKPFRYQPILSRVYFILRILPNVNCGRWRRERTGVISPSTSLKSTGTRVSGKSFSSANFLTYISGLWIRIRDPDPDWIRIQSGLWIRIRIRNPDPDPGGQIWPTKVEKNW